MVGIYTLAVQALLATSATALSSLTIKGSKFFADGNQFYIKGIAYQLEPTDPLVNGTQCQLDANLMKSIGANAIRVYHVDPTQNHDACMQTFDAAGIYAFIDLDTFNTQIEQDDPHWNSTQYAAFAKIIDAFAKYENVAGLFIGNEVITTANGSAAAPFVKAATRDMKAYRNSKGYRQIPIGYSAADIAQLRPMLQNYLACGTNTSETIDFFSLNAYEWCGQSSYAQSGYQALNANVTNFPVPIFFSETGCNTPMPRTFDDQAAIFGPDMAPYWSGAIIYEWIQEANNYGLIQYGAYVDPATPGAPPDGWPRSGTPTPREPDFDNLKGQWATLAPSGVQLAAYTATPAAISCPASTAGVWDVNPTAPLPLLNGATPAGSASPSSSGSAKGGATSSYGVTTSAMGLAFTHTALAAATAVTARGMKALVLPGIFLASVWWLAVGGIMAV